MINVILRDYSAHLATKYGVLNQADFNLIFENLDAAKSPTLDYFDLVEPHRDLHGLLVGAGQISTEYNKAKCPQARPGRSACHRDFLSQLPLNPRSHLWGPHRNSNSSRSNFYPHQLHLILDYSNAMSTTASALAAPIDAAGHAQIIAEHQKELAALKKPNGVVPRPCYSPKTSGHKYFYVYAYQKSHIGRCRLQRPKGQRTAAVHCATPRCHGPSNSCQW